MCHKNVKSWDFEFWNKILTTILQPSCQINLPNQESKSNFLASSLANEWIMNDNNKNTSSECESNATEHDGAPSALYQYSKYHTGFLERWYCCAHDWWILLVFVAIWSRDRIDGGISTLAHVWFFLGNRHCCGIAYFTITIVLANEKHFLKKIL